MVKDKWHDSIFPLKEDLSYYTLIADHTLSLKITNKHDKPVFITGSYFFCNRVINPDGANYLKKELVSPSFGTLKIEPHDDKIIYLSLNQKEEADINDKQKACRISAIIEDYYGSSAILSLPVAIIDINGTYTSPAE